jgi:predicted permease
MSLHRYFRRRQWDRDRSRELESHLAHEIDDNIARGMTPEEARRQAYIKFGNPTLIREDIWQMNSLTFLESLWRDVRYALRQLLKSPGFTVTAVLTLALGIGANTAIFSLMDAVLLRSLPVKQPDRLFTLDWTAKTWPHDLRLSGYYKYEFSYPMFERFRDEHKIFSSVFGFAPLGFEEGNVAVGLHGQTGAATGTMVTEGYFSGLGVSPVLGRAITEDDARQDAIPVAVISYGYWQRTFGGSASVLGQHITLNGQPYTIVGVAPPKFFGLQAGRQDDLWIPVVNSPTMFPWASRAAPGQTLTSQKWWWLVVVGRLQPGVSPQQATVGLNPVLRAGFQSAFGSTLKPENSPRMEVVSGNHGLDYLEGFYKQPLQILMAIVALLLLAACASLATLLLARAAGRSKEIAVRLATGATRARVVRQLLTESVLLSGMGTGMGLLLALLATRSLAALIASGSGPLRVDVSPNPTVLGFTAGISVLTGILFGLAPAWRATRVDLVSTLKETTGKSLGEMRRHRFALGKVLIVVQVAISMLLLVGAGYMLRSLEKLEDQNIGIARNHRLVFSIDPELSGYTDQHQLQLYETLRRKLQALPGVKSATAAKLRLIANWMSNGYVEVEGHKAADGNKLSVDMNSVGPGFLETTGIPLIAGRDINDHDTPTSTRVAIINQVMAEKYFGKHYPIGLHITRKLAKGETVTYEIVGICANAKYTSLRDPIAPTFYYPYTQQQHYYGMTFYLRTYGDPNTLVPAVRHLVHDLDPSLLMTGIRSQSEQIDESIVPERMLARLASFFGAVALLLAGIGLNGTLAYAVNRRSKEIGIRMALGARRGQVVLLVLGETIMLIVLGIALGIPLAIASARAVSSQLYGIHTFDLPTLIGASAALLMAAVLSGYLPARRAASIDPMQALRAG